MRKTLKRMKKNVFKKLREYNEIRPKAKGETAPKIVVKVIVAGDKTIESLLNYAKTLEDHIFEVDEEWDKLIKEVEKAQQRQRTQKKPPYRV